MRRRHILKDLRRIGGLEVGIQDAQLSRSGVGTWLSLSSTVPFDCAGSSCCPERADPGPQTDDQVRTTERQARLERTPSARRRPSLCRRS
jgi:hypothetical protein